MKKDQILIPVKNDSNFWTCTNQLRYYGNSKYDGYVLQQLWVSDKGEEKWEDVPVIENT